MTREPEGRRLRETPQAKVIFSALEKANPNPGGRYQVKREKTASATGSHEELRAPQKTRVSLENGTPV